MNIIIFVIGVVCCIAIVVKNKKTSGLVLRTTQLLRIVFNINSFKRFSWNNGVFGVDLSKRGVLLTKPSLEIIRYCDYFSYFNIRKEIKGQMSEDSEIIHEKDGKCIAITGAVRGFDKIEDDKKEVLIHLLNNSWESISQNGNVIKLAGYKKNLENLSEDEIIDSMKILSSLDKEFMPDWKKGIATFREGNSGEFAWNWSGRHLAKAKEHGLNRFCISYYFCSPYLNPFILRVIRSLYKNGEILFVFKKEMNFSNIEGFFDFQFNGGIISTKSDDCLISLDWEDEGSFIAAIAPKIGHEKQVIELIHGAKSYNLFETLLDNFEFINFTIRRLFDWEASWYSGEYEILSRTTKKQLLQVTDNIALQYDAQLVEIKEPFNAKILLDEQFISG